MALCNPDIEGETSVMANKTPALEGDHWIEARDALQAYSRALGKFRETLTPVQKHHWHGSLRTYARGLVTPPIHTGWGALEMRLDLVDCHASLIGSDGRAGRLSLAGLPANRLAYMFKGKLSEWQVEADVDIDSFGDISLADVATAAAGDIWRVMIWADSVLKKLKAKQRAETSEVQLWPHHFDLAMLWLSGHRIPDEDANDPAVADEQINVGFSFGDNYPRPYFYLTVYPGVVEFPDNSLPEFAEWNTDGWSGVRVPYDGLAGMKKPEKLILDLFTALIEDASLQLKEAR
jgi:hypothetical protein